VANYCNQKMNINDIQNEIIENFAIFDNKNDTYDYIIELSKNLPPFPEEHRTEENIIKGCQSKVWVYPIMQGEQVYFYGDSDSSLVKGLVSLLISILSEQKPKDIFEADLYFMDKIGLKVLLSMNRANGLASMVKQMKLYALAIESAV
jgi:cysteine desulfuration protein SufE